MAGELLVFVRCHTLPEFVLDTVDSIERLSETSPRIVITVDYRESVESYLLEKRSDLMVYRSKQVCGWGAGMYRLFAEALTWYLGERGLDFEYLLNMDYDLIFTERGADVRLLDNAKRGGGVGLWGKYVGNGSYWQLKVKRALPKLVKFLKGKGIDFPFRYRVGEHVAGACALLTRECVERLSERGLLGEDARVIGYSTGLADDPLLSFYVKAVGMELGGLDSGARIVWKEDGDYRRWAGRCYLYHPTKLVPGSGKWSVELERECRNFWRQRRGQEPLGEVVGETGPLAMRI